MLQEPTDDPRVDLALRRTEWALERTQLAWVRTAFVMISAGLALDQSTAALSQAELLSQGPRWVVGGHVGGVILAASASILLGMATVSYAKRASELKAASNRLAAPMGSVLPLSVLVVLLGAAVVALLLLWG